MNALGELTPITLPDHESEALRDLVRAREDALLHRRRARRQRKADETKDEPRHLEDGTLVVAVWALASTEASDARPSIENALPSNACNAVTNRRISC